MFEGSPWRVKGHLLHDQRAAFTLSKGCFRIVKSPLSHGQRAAFKKPKAGLYHTILSHSLLNHWPPSY